jgi:fatty-acyl-CoA synthase
MASALEAMAPKPDLSTLKFIISSGAMWSRETKARLIEQIPQLITVDVFAASESLHFGASMAMKNNIGETAKVLLSPNAKILKECGAEAKPGEAGLIAVRDTIAVGYFGDEEKTARTYREIDGVRWCIPGDWAKIEQDGSVTLLGRGSNCINSAGEKVFPEEVEEVLKLAAGVKDALVVGVPDERWGNAVVAVVTADEDGDERALREFVGARLARYKAPKRVFFTRDVLRLANGKADYKAARAIAAGAQ